MNKSDVIREFKKYGFEYREKSSCNSFLVFTFRSGFFHNAEIVILEQGKNSESLSRVSRELQDVGITAKISNYKSLEELKTNLFHGFFDTERWREKINSEHKTFVDRTLKSLPSENVSYSYITTPYTRNSKKKEQSNIISDIISDIKTDGSSLILIEAPAGFGKTSTSYELTHKLANAGRGFPMPFFTEFSRDRQARVFSHVFVREVDRNFRDIKSDVVISELQSGNVVIILDGFDELLSDKNGHETTEHHEKAEPMLETIGELLSGNAKIILTSRRSALFDGETFDGWLSRYHDNFEFIRYRIFSPQITDWLEPARLERLKNIEIDIEDLSNPVLLTYLRSLSENDFIKLCSTPSKIVNQYFTSMLEREQERQNLNISPSDQAKILSEIAGDMCENGYKSDSKDKLIETIKSRCGRILEDSRKRYPAKDRPTADSLANTLSNHAFFDRSNQGDNRIEFVNEFVLGNYIADYILNFDGEWLPNDEGFVEPAINSYIPRTLDERQTLWKKISPIKDYIEQSTLMKFESNMTDGVNDIRYDNASINSINFNETSFFFEGKLNSTIFSSCRFKDCKFNFNNIKDSTFINCKFFDCRADGVISEDNIDFINCSGDNTIFISQIEQSSPVVEEETEKLSDLRREIFETYLPVGSNSIERLHIPLSLLLKIDIRGITRKDIYKEIRQLKSLGYLTDAHSTNFIAINKARISEIKQILGRV